MLLQIHQMNPCCKRKTPHQTGESVVSSNVSVVATSAPPPPPTPSCPEGGRNCNNNIWGRAIMKVSQSGCCFRKINFNFNTATQFDKTVIRVKPFFRALLDFLIHLEEIIVTHSSTHLLIHLSGYGEDGWSFSHVSLCERWKTHWTGWWSFIELPHCYKHTHIIIVIFIYKALSAVHNHS